VLSPPVTFTRRDWAITCLCAGFAIAFLPGCRKKNNGAKEEPAKELPREPLPEEIEITLDLNGETRTLKVEPRVSLLDALRERLALPGTKKGCDAGQCGACTVHIDGKRVLSCLTLAVMAQGKPITTIEGLSRGADLHPMQKAFIAHDGLQCGYCTPGQIMSAVALLAEGRAKTDDEVREHMSGNICRCGAYPNIVAAIQAARRGA
jgi:xanthine dehydrogenase YagT iron-sulfur-binding subunit